MCKLFLVRNLLSVKVANAISEDKEDIFLSANGIDTLNNLIKKSKKKDNPLLFLNPLKIKDPLTSYHDVKNFRDRVKAVMLRERISEVLITYPLHIDGSVFYSVARELGIKVSFFEEGLCFYRSHESNQYSNHGIKGFLKKLYYSYLRVGEGYDFRADNFYYTLDGQEVDGRKVQLDFTKLDDLKHVEYLFLSRPASEDFKGINFEDEVSSICKFYNHVVKKENKKLYIKFHPRESEIKRASLLKELDGHGLQIEELKVGASSEDVVFSMEKGAICGYETTTLIYANIINRNVEVFSVAEQVMGLDDTKVIQGFIAFYKDKFSHVKYI
ncbi:polysialyltransferase family glycosyltransferase [Pseudoalteromonas piscicida]